MLTHPVFGISHLDIPVRDLRAAEAFYCTGLGASVGRRLEGAVDLELAGFSLRLLAVSKDAPRVTFRALCGDVERAVEGLVSAGGSEVYPPSRIGGRELVAAVHDPFGNTVIAWRSLTEDEYDEPVELPKELRWDPEAEELLTSLLAAVPALFRGLARNRSTKMAEELAKNSGLVTRTHAIRGYVLASAKVTRSRTRQPLIDHGIDPDHFADDYDAD